ncbi:MAG: flippase [bacterium]
MKNASRIAGNFGLKLFSDLYSKIGMLVLVLCVARVFGAEAFGKYAVSFALVNIFYIFTDFGLHTLLVRDIGKERSIANEYWEKFLSIKLISALAAVILIFITAQLISFPADTKRIIVAASIWMVANSLIDGSNALFTAYEKLHFVLWNTLIYRTLLYIIGFTAIYFNAALFNIIMIIAGSSVLGSITGLYFINKYFFKFNVKFSWSFFLKRIKNSWPLALSGVFMTIYMRIDTILLSKMKGDIETGIYNSAFKLFETLVFIPTVFQNVALPYFARYVFQDDDRVIAASAQASAFMLILSLPMSIALIIKADWVMNLLYGSKYDGGETALSILACAIPFLFALTIPASVLIAANKQKIIGYSSLAATLINITGNILLIPVSGYVGSSIMLLATHVVLFLVLAIAAKRWVINRLVLWKFVRVVLAGVLMSCLLVFIDFKYDLLGILAGFLIFYGCLIPLRVIHLKEIREFIISFKERNV